MCPTWLLSQGIQLSLSDEWFLSARHTTEWIFLLQKTWIEFESSQRRTTKCTNTRNKAFIPGAASFWGNLHKIRSTRDEMHYWLNAKEVKTLVDSTLKRRSFSCKSGILTGTGWGNNKKMMFFLFWQMWGIAQRVFRAQHKST